MGRGCVEPLPLCPRVLRRSLSHLGTEDPSPGEDEPTGRSQENTDTATENQANTQPGSSSSDLFSHLPEAEGVGRPSQGQFFTAQHNDNLDQSWRHAEVLQGELQGQVI